MVVLGSYEGMIDGVSTTLRVGSLDESQNSVELRVEFELGGNVNDAGTQSV